MAGYFTNLKAEFKKVVWPDKKRVLRQSVAVVLSSVVLGLLIALIDAAVKAGLGLIL